MCKSEYPIYLVPKPSYLKLMSEDVKNGVVLRSYTDPVYPKLVDGKIPVTVFTHPNTGSILNHMSVNLVGVYQLADAAWVLTGKNKDKLTNEWIPGMDGIQPLACAPTTEDQDEFEPEVKCLDSWGCWWLPLQALYGKVFKSDNIEYKCSLQHKHTQCNYWHFELHFNAVGDKTDAKDLKNGPAKRLASEIRMDLVQNAKTEHDAPVLKNKEDSSIYEYADALEVVAQQELVEKPV